MPSSGAISTSRLYWLDWLRFLAAFMVLVVHARNASWVEYRLLDDSNKVLTTQIFFLITRLGKEAVIVFFVMSGFLVGGGVAERLLLKTFDIKKYIIDRLTRIYIPLVPALIPAGLISCLVFGNNYSDYSLSAGIGNLLGLQGVFFSTYAGNGPLWSLAYEIWFYILAGAIAATVSSTCSKAQWFVCLFLIILSLSIFTKLDCTYLYIWGIGAFTYYFRRIIRANGTLYLGICLAVIGIVACELTSDSRSVHLEEFSYLLPSKSVAEIAFGAGIALLLPAISSFPPRNSFINRLEQYGTGLAAFSYTLYLTHYPVLLCLAKFFPPAQHIDFASIIRFILMVIFSAVFAWFFYWAFEARTNKVRYWLINKLQ